MAAESERIKIIQYKADAFSNTIQNMTYISNALGELASAPSAIVYSSSLCCPLKCRYFCCGNLYPYTTLVNDGVTQKFLFKNLGVTKFSICSGDQLAKFHSISSFSLSSFDQYNTDGGLLFCDLIKEPGCSCCGCCSVTFDVNLKTENRVAGYVQLRGCCSECCKKKDDTPCCKDCCHITPHMGDILDNNKQFKYAIYYRTCCLCCIPDCGIYKFVIRDSNGNDVGRIEGRGNCFPLCGDSLTYTITFPLDATPELKLSIINNVMLMDLLGR